MVQSRKLAKVFDRRLVVGASRRNFIVVSPKINKFSIHFDVGNPLLVLSTPVNPLESTGAVSTEGDVLGILSSRCSSKILHSVIEGVSIDVVNLLPFRNWKQLAVQIHERRFSRRPISMPRSIKLPGIWAKVSEPIPPCRPLKFSRTNDGNLSTSQSDVANGLIFRLCDGWPLYLPNFVNWFEAFSAQFRVKRLLSGALWANIVTGELTFGRLIVERLDWLHDPTLNRIVRPFSRFSIVLESKCLS